MIQQITQVEASEIIRTYEPIGLFYLLDGDTYVGINNLTGHAWTEEFNTFEECKAWLEGDEDSTFKEIQSEVYRTYRVLGLQGFCQNETDLAAWLKEGYISSEDYKTLHQLNRALYNKFGKE